MQVEVVESVEFQNPVRAVGASKLSFKLKHFNIPFPQTSLVRSLGQTTVCLAPYDQPFLCKVKISTSLATFKNKQNPSPMYIVASIWL